MSLRLTDILEGIVEEETQIKLANVEKAYADDADRVNLLDEALDIIKEASDKGDIPELNSSEALSLAVELVEAEMQEKEAEAWFEIGQVTAGLLNEIGITPDEISKVASDDDQEALGRIAARAYMTYSTGQDYLGLEEEKKD